MKLRLLSLLLILSLLMLPCASAEEDMFSYIPQKGVEYHMLGDGGQFEVPEGLDTLYRLFGYGDNSASVCVFRMPNGRALVSVSCMPLPEPVAIEDLYIAKAEIARGLTLSMGDALAAPPDFRMEELWGEKVMAADMQLLGDNNMSLTAKAVLFSRENELVEVWWAHPGKLAYAFDPQAEKELTADLKTLQKLVDSFEFSNSTSVSIPHVNITADNGTFAISAPLDVIVINADTDAATVSRALARFAELEGGAECFNLWYEDVLKRDCWLLLSPEYGLAAQIFVETKDAYKELSLDDFAALDTTILEDRLKDRYETAAPGAESERIELDGKEHLWFTYDLSHAGMELLSYIFCAVENGTAYELDIFLAVNTGKDMEDMSNAVLLLMETVDYFPQG
ncbi:MAG: hypothetical protein IKK08_08620 [Clostridia bacterium]|nr:hypothetical protein [Clostridia bacterium]